MVRGKTIALIGVLGALSYMKWGNEVFNAEESNGFATIVERIKSKFSKSDMEQITTERSGMTVDVIPQQFSPAVSQAGHFAFDKTTTYVNMGVNGAGVSDVKMSVQDAYADNLSAEDFLAFNATAPGQEVVASAQLPLHSIQPTTNDASVGRTGLPMMQGKQSVGTVSASNNDSYTDGSITQPLSKWQSEGSVDIINGCTANFRPYIGGTQTMLRRV